MPHSPIARLLLAGLVLLLAWVPVPPAGAQALFTQTLADFAVLNGRFFTQAAGGPRRGEGFTISDEGGIPFWSEYQRLGGVDALGYPVSRRFQLDGFVLQATQRAVLQWRPELGLLAFVNVFDELSAAGLDEWLAAFRGIPPPAAAPEEAGISFGEIVQLRLRLVREVPRIAAVYFSAPDPLLYYGLPVAPAVDLGPVIVVRAQRAAFQLWRVPTSFARPGEVTVVNGGDLAKEAGILPNDALVPEPASRAIAAPLGRPEHLDDQTIAAMREAVERVRPAVVRLTDGSPSHGSGVIIDASGLILTNWHVVANLDRRILRAALPDGRTLPAKVLGGDEWTDVALVTVQAPDLVAATFGDQLARGQRVLALGYAPALPGSPSAKAGVVTAVNDRIQTPNDFPLFGLIRTTVFLHPGDSGGPLFNLQGEVVGLNAAIRTGGNVQLAGLSIPVDGAQAIAQQILAEGKVSRPWLGVSLNALTPGLALELGLPATRGLLVREVVRRSPADAAGLVPGDMMLALQGRTLASVSDLRRELVNFRVGDMVRLTVLSRQGTQRTVTVQLAERPADL